MYKYALWQNISEFANRDSSKNYICQLAKNLRIHKLQNTYMLFGRIFANSQTAILAKIKICQLAENLLIHRFHNAYVRGQGGCRCMVGQARAAVRCDAVGRAPRKKSTDKSLGISLIGSQKRAEGRARKNAQRGGHGKTRRGAGTGGSTVDQVDVPEIPDAEKSDMKARGGLFARARAYNRPG